MGKKKEEIDQLRETWLALRAKAFIAQELARRASQPFVEAIRAEAKPLISAWNASKRGSYIYEYRGIQIESACRILVILGGIRERRTGELVPTERRSPRFRSDPDDLEELTAELRTKGLGGDDLEICYRLEAHYYSGDGPLPRTYGF